MCGIATIFSYTADAPPVDSAELLRIRERMAARGPDGCGLWIDRGERVGLAHRRLSIIDLSDSGAQPMASPDGSLVVVFNGEIYNHRELRGELAARGCRFNSSSDTEVLLHLYAEMGEEMLHRLRGMYAFAIWDSRRQGLFLARDPFGIKPLYYADDGRTFRAASQVKALLAGGRVDTSPEPAGHVGFFTWGNVPEPYTLYRGVRALPAGSSLFVDRRGRSPVRRFCSIPEVLADAFAARKSLSVDDQRRELREALLDSVRHHLLADVKVGVFLSSGLDSTTLAALTSEVAPDSLNTVTLGFREFAGTSTDEVPLAEEVARCYGANHRTITVERGDFSNELDRLLDGMDQPSIDGVNSYFVCQAAAKAGLKVAISGLGGDELFGSYPSFAQVPRMVRLAGPVGAIPGIGRSFRWLAAFWIGQIASPKYAGLFEYGGSYGGAYLLRRGLFMPWELSQILDPELVRNGWNELQTLFRLEETTAGVPGDFLKVSALEMCWYMRNQLLRDSDWASMAHSIELRVPLVDLELLKKALLLCSGGKAQLASAPAVPLPAAVVNRPKTGFSIPVRQWLTGPAESQGRGLRGWARLVYDRHCRT